jgi:hypothetical protein
MGSRSRRQRKRYQQRYSAGTQYLNRDCNQKSANPTLNTKPAKQLDNKRRKATHKLTAREGDRVSSASLFNVEQSLALGQLANINR